MYNLLFLIALIGSGLLVAIIGWLDDRIDLSAGVRLIGHVFAAGWALFWLGGLPPLMVFGHTLDFGLIGNCLAALYLVWLLNLYNFMDGIDGIAGIECVTVCFGSIVLWFVYRTEEFLWMPSAIVASATIGFLFWNFPRAKIFMGDVGSGFLGLVLGVISLKAGWVMSELFWVWIILIGTFVVDATMTLLCRALKGEKVYEAHRSHAYQHAAIKVKSHAPVSLIFGAINLFWLLPVAWLVAAGKLDGFVGVIISYFPLAIMALWLQAGKDFKAEK